MMKKIFLLSLIAILGMATSVWALSYSGSLSTSDGSLVVGGTTTPPEWYDASLSWTVTQLADGSWRYEYTWQDLGEENLLRDLSHIDIEVSSNFELSDLISWLSDPKSTLEGPEFMDGLYGFKWDLSADSVIFNLTLISSRAPMWGDIYAKGGMGDQIYAKNAFFGIDSMLAISDGNAGGWALVPDTAETVIPEPSTVFLLGIGLVAILGLGRKLKK